MFTKPKKSLGQNFLVDKNIQEKIITVCRVTKKDIVLEIGSGRGEITGHLIRKAKKVIAVELDKNLCGILKSRFASCANFELLSNDILKLSLSKYKHLKVIANIPYYISSPIITHLIKYRGSIKTIFLTIQKEVGLRLIAGPGSKDYSSFSCFIQYYTEPKIHFLIKNASFWPKPKVDSCFIELAIRAKPPVKISDEDMFFKVIRTAFNQRRKQLKNSLAGLLPENKLSQARAEDLSLSDFARLVPYAGRGVDHKQKIC